MFTYVFEISLQLSRVHVRKTCLSNYCLFGEIYFKANNKHTNKQITILITYFKVYFDNCFSKLFHWGKTRVRFKKFLITSFLTFTIFLSSQFFKWIIFNKVNTLKPSNPSKLTEGPCIFLTYPMYLRKYK